jgi:hypothetical protein
MRSILILAFSVSIAAVEGPLAEPFPTPPRLQGAAPAQVAPVVPAAQAKPMAIEFTWDDYTSVVVIGDGIGQFRPAWVATYEQPVLTGSMFGIFQPVVGLFGYGETTSAPPLAVAYRAQAWLDAQGRLHIDAKSAVIAGPQADQWSPDSFIFTFPERVETVDDNASENHGKIDRVVDAVSQAAAYQELLTRVQVLVGDGI